MTDKLKYQVAFIGAKTFVYSPNFASLKAALNWYARNSHRVVEDKQLLINDGNKVLEWVHPDQPEASYDGWRMSLKIKNS